LDTSLNWVVVAIFNLVLVINLKRVLKALFANQLFGDSKVVSLQF